MAKISADEYFLCVGYLTKPVCTVIITSVQIQSCLTNITSQDLQSNQTWVNDNLHQMIVPTASKECTPGHLSLTA